MLYRICYAALHAAKFNLIDCWELNCAGKRIDNEIRKHAFYASWITVSWYLKVVKRLFRAQKWWTLRGRYFWTVFFCRCFPFSPGQFFSGGLRNFACFSPAAYLYKGKAQNWIECGNGAEVRSPEKCHSFKIIFLFFPRRDCFFFLWMQSVAFRIYCRFCSWFIFDRFFVLAIFCALYRTDWNFLRYWIYKKIYCIFSLFFFAYMT